MKFDLTSVLKLLPAVGPVVAALPEFKKVFDQIVGTFKTKDQAQLREAYEDLMADNDEGHARLQAKLAAAAQR
jgi:hypothetical protein